ncbi:DUF5993 family protein [Propionivibrio sp.]|uniref:DUF5993 family protein n=1 Tax=Propionivibrio sp. TaxID=2212460 RepID=UPI003BF44B40
MVMVLPFLIAMVAIVGILLDRTQLGIWAWVLLMGIYLAWCKYHMTDALALTL